MLSHLKQAAAIARLTSFDTDTDSGRAKERYRRVILTAITSAGAKAVNLVASLVSVRLAVRHLGTERYGLWMTVNSLVYMLGFADMGIGNGLLNAVSEASGRDDRDAARRYVSTATAMLAAVAVVLLVFFLLFYPYIPWGSAFNVESPLAVAEAGPAVLALFVTFVANIPLGVAPRVQNAYQEGYRANLWSAGAGLLSLVAIIVAVQMEAGLPFLVLSIAGPPVMMTFANGVSVFFFERTWLRPSFRIVDRQAGRRILGQGLLFLLLQTAVTVVFSSDNIIAAHVFGPDTVALYAVTLRLFSLFPMLLYFVQAPLWPAYSEAIARGDSAWVKRTLRMSLGGAVLSSIFAGGVLVVLGNWLIHLWVGSQMTPPLGLLYSLAVWTALGAVGNAAAMFLNGSQQIAVQAGLSVMLAGSSIALKLLVGRTLGIAGLVWANTAAYIVCIAVPFIVYVPRVIARIEGRNARQCHL